MTVEVIAGLTVDSNANDWATHLQSGLYAIVASKIDERRLLAAARDTLSRHCRTTLQLQLQYRGREVVASKLSQNTTQSADHPASPYQNRSGHTV